MTIRSIWNDTVLAESDDTVVVEGDHYFPRESLPSDQFEAAEEIRDRVAFWKGVEVTNG